MNDVIYGLFAVLVFILITSLTFIILDFKLKRLLSNINKSNEK